MGSLFLVRLNRLNDEFQGFQPTTKIDPPLSTGQNLSNNIPNSTYQIDLDFDHHADQVHLDSEPRRQDPPGQVVQQLRGGREAETHRGGSRTRHRSDLNDNPVVLSLSLIFMF